jgi:acyl-CoA thioester hydrolase
MTELWTASRADIVALRASDFAVLRTIATRWRDNDAYGHINNALYYEFFDTAINGWLLEELPGTEVGDTQMFVAESGCKYLSEIAFPAPLLLGLNVARIGSSSVTYELAIFTAGDEPGPIAALGRWVHVFVDGHSHAPTPIPDDVRALLETAVR